MTQFNEQQSTVIVPKGSKLEDMIDFEDGTMKGEEPMNEELVEVVYE